MQEQNEAQLDEKASSALRGIKTSFSANMLLIAASIAWWGAHYTLLWSPQVAAAYSVFDGFDIRFLLSVAGTVAVFGPIVLATRKDGSSAFCASPVSFIAYAACSLVALALMSLPIYLGSWIGLGFIGATVSGMGNAVAMVFLGELHVRVGYRNEPLAFAAEMIGGIVLFLLVSTLPTIVELPCAAILVVVATLLFLAYSARSKDAARLDDNIAVPSQELPIRVDMTVSQLAVFSVLIGATYGLTRVFLLGGSDLSGINSGFWSECLGSFLCALLLVAVFVLQRSNSLFEICLVFVIPLVATGMFLVSVPQVTAVVPSAVCTVGLACFFNLLWYFAAVQSAYYKRYSVTFVTSLLFFACQLGQALGALVPFRASGVFSTTIIYALLMAVALFVYWHAHSSRVSDQSLQRLAFFTVDASQPPIAAEGLTTLWERNLGLSPREAQVALLLIQRIPYRQIGSRLCVSENTVKTHARNIYKKAGVSSREELHDKLATLSDCSEPSLLANSSASSSIPPRFDLAKKG